MPQIGTYELDAGGSIVEVPVYEPGNVSDDYLRVRTANGVGAVPLTDPSNASHPYLRVQTAGGVMAIDDVSSVSSSAIHRWPISAGSGSTITDTIGSADGTLSATDFWTSGTWVDGYALSGDGSDNYADTGANAGLTGQMAFAITAEFSTLSTTNGPYYIASGGFDGTNTTWELRLASNALETGSFDGSAHQTTLATSNLTTGTKYRIVGQYTGTDWEIWINATRESQTSDGTGAVSSNANRTILALDENGSIVNYGRATVDNPILANSSWTATEIQDDYNAQPWS